MESDEELDDQPKIPAEKIGTKKARKLEEKEARAMQRKIEEEERQKAKELREEKHAERMKRLEDEGLIKSNTIFAFSGFGSEIMKF